MVYRILVASYTNDVATLVFDPDTPSLKFESSLTVGHHPSWITSYPGDSSLVFTGLEQAEGKVLAIKYGDGKAEVLATAPSGGADPCSLLATKDELLVANYSGGSVSVFPISPNPPYLLSSTPTTLIKLEGTGPNTSRQESSHPHQVFLHEANGEVLVPDLGADKVLRLKKSEDGEWKIVGNIDYKAGGGPRHLATNGSNLYTLLELSSFVSQHTFPAINATTSTPLEITTVPTMSQPFPTPNDMLAAEILVPVPNSQFPTPYLYLSNRNDPSPEGDIISIFQVPNGTEEDANTPLKLIKEVRTGLNHVRGILFGGQDDRWLITGGANGGGVKVYERVDGGKDLKFVVGLEVKAPTGFLWV